MEHRFTSLPPDPFMCSSDEKQSRSPLALYSEYQRMDIELRPPHAMPTSHWHGQVEVNGEVEYQRGKKLHEGDVITFNGESVQIGK